MKVKDLIKLLAQKNFEDDVYVTVYGKGIPRLTFDIDNTEPLDQYAGGSVHINAIPLPH